MPKTKATEAKRNHLFTHGESGRKPEYYIWASMKDRCENANNPSYKNYGGRGILVCERWHTYENFLADMGRRPTSKHTLGRVNNNGNYEPSNCRWETHIEQLNNTRKNVFFEHNGERLSITQIARIENVSISKLHWYIREMKKPLSEAISLIRGGGLKNKKVVVYTIEGIEIGRFPSIIKAAIETNSDESKVSLCCSGIRKTHNNLIFKLDNSKT